MTSSHAYIPDQATIAEIDRIFHGLVAERKASIVGQYGDTFVTPDPRIGILNGTSQRELFAWALEEGKKVEYRKLPLAELREADHLFMTHGGWAIPVCELDGRPYEVDAAQVEAINDAMHTGRTHDLALTIGPSGDYEF